MCRHLAYLGTRTTLASVLSNVIPGSAERA